jgi:hypothetical protein
MVDLVERIASAVQSQLPYAYCFPCLATRLGATEPDVRSGAQALVMRQGFRRDRRVCCSCGCVDDVLTRLM